MLQNYTYAYTFPLFEAMVLSGSFCSDRAQALAKCTPFRTVVTSWGS